MFDAVAPLTQNPVTPFVYLLFSGGLFRRDAFAGVWVPITASTGQEVPLAHGFRGDDHVGERLSLARDRWSRLGAHFWTGEGYERLQLGSCAATTYCKRVLKSISSSGLFASKCNNVSRGIYRALGLEEPLLARVTSLELTFGSIDRIVFNPQAYEGFALKEYQHEGTTGVHVECLLQEGLFAAGVWIFWLIFIASTIDRAPKRVSFQSELCRYRCWVVWDSSLSSSPVF